MGGRAHGFLKQLPRDFRYAVGARNPELLTDDHGAVLAAPWRGPRVQFLERVPAIGEQLELPWTFPTGFTVARGLPPPRAGVCRRGEAVRALRPDRRSATGGATGSSAAYRRSDPAPLRKPCPS